MPLNKETETESKHYTTRGGYWITWHYLTVEANNS